jgi:hypothetical protein
VNCVKNYQPYYSQPRIQTRSCKFHTNYHFFLLLNLALSANRHVKKTKAQNTKRTGSVLANVNLLWRETYKSASLSRSSRKKKNKKNKRLKKNNNNKLKKKK